MYCAKSIHRVLIAIVALLAFLAAACSDSHDDGMDEEIFASLDNAIAHRDQLLAPKMHRIDSLRMVASVSRGRPLYDIYRNLYDEYYSFNYDTALHFAEKRVELAHNLHLDEEKFRSLIKLTRAYVSLGRGVAAAATLEEASADTVTAANRRDYYDARISYELISRGDPLPWYERLLAVIDTNSADGIWTKSSMLEYKADFSHALEVLSHDSVTLHASPHITAITDYKRGRLSLLLGDTVAGMNYLASAAYNDLVTPVRDYRSLYELASVLFKKGDVERAYRYITYAVKDLSASKETGNMLAAVAIMPTIVAAYEQQQAHIQRRHYWSIAGIALLSVLLAAALIVYARMHRVVTRKAENEQALNAELKKINNRLQEINGRLSESNKVKDAYLMQYFNLCSYFIDCLDKYRAGVEKASRTGGLKAVEKFLASRQSDDFELKIFYSNFDETFLKIFPTFVESFNALLNPEARVEIGPDGHLPNELRTFALIRLGVTDSRQIADFLRRSVSTIYNYRVKFRNAALISRDDFEKAVTSIGG